MRCSPRPGAVPRTRQRAGSATRPISRSMSLFPGVGQRCSATWRAGQQVLANAEQDPILMTQNDEGVWTEQSTVSQYFTADPKGLRGNVDLADGLRPAGRPYVRPLEPAPDGCPRDSAGDQQQPSWVSRSAPWTAQRQTSSDFSPPTSKTRRVPSSLRPPASIDAALGGRVAVPERQRHARTELQQYHGRGRLSDAHGHLRADLDQPAAQHGPG